MRLPPPLPAAVDGVVYVIDTGMVKQKDHNPRTGMDSLTVVPISRVQVCGCGGGGGVVVPTSRLRVWCWGEGRGDGSSNRGLGLADHGAFLKGAGVVLGGWGAAATLGWGWLVVVPFSRVPACACGHGNAFFCGGRGDVRKGMEGGATWGSLRPRSDGEIGKGLCWQGAAGAAPRSAVPTYPRESEPVGPCLLIALPSDALPSECPAF